jgi:uncharacterized integral membrane protein
VRILRTIIWVLALIGFLIFAIYNWQPVELTLWQNLVLETKVPVLAFLAFAAGFVPLFTYHLSVKWALNRRVRTLENSLKNSALARQSEASPSTTAPFVDTPVEKPGKSAGEGDDPLSPADDFSSKGAAT